MHVPARCDASRVYPKRPPCEGCRRSRSERVSSFQQYANQFARRVFGPLRIGDQIGIGASERRNIARAVPIDRSDFAAELTQAGRKEAGHAGPMPEIAGEACKWHRKRRILLA